MINNLILGFLVRKYEAGLSSKISLVILLFNELACTILRAVPISKFITSIPFACNCSSDGTNKVIFACKSSYILSNCAVFKIYQT